MVQGNGQLGADFAKDINDWVSEARNKVAVCEYQFTTAQDGRQTCNLIYTRVYEQCNKHSSNE